MTSTLRVEGGLRVTETSPEAGVPNEPQPISQADMAKLKGYTGDACDECGCFTMVRNGACLKCNNCGATSGCS